MDRLRLAGLTVAGIAATLALTAAQRPALFGQTVPGLWEISGIPGDKAAARECVTDTAELARYEHRSRSCTMNVTSDSANFAVVDYSCGGAGFGHTEDRPDHSAVVADRDSGRLRQSAVQLRAAGAARRRLPGDQDRRAPLRRRLTIAR